MVSLLACSNKQIPADFGPLFDNEAKLAKDQTIQCTGLVDADGDNTTLHVKGGKFTILKDAQGKQLHDSMDMRFVEIHGRLTGDSLASLSFSMSSPFYGTAGNIKRIPQVKVEGFEVGKPDRELDRFLKTRFAQELQCYIEAVAEGCGGFILGADTALDKVKRVLKAYPDLISSTDKDGSTMLMLAVGQGSQANALTKWLIANGADVNARNNAGVTALQWAYGNEEIKTFLREHGARQ